MSHRLQILIPDDLNAQLTKIAHRNRLSKGEWVRRALETALHAPGGSSDPVMELASLHAPTADIGLMLAEIEKGRA